MSRTTRHSVLEHPDPSPASTRGGGWVAWLLAVAAAGVVALGAPRQGAAEARPPVVVTPGSERTFRIALQLFADGSVAPDRADVSAFRDEIVAGLDFSGVFQVIDFDAFLGPTVTEGLDNEEVLANCGDWTQIGADGMVDGRLIVEAQNFTAEFRVWDGTRCSRLVAKRYRQDVSGEVDAVAKRIADDIVGAFVGQRGVSSTEIAFVSTRTGNPEIFVMDADGRSARAATKNGSINVFPSWSPGGDAIVYTSYRHLNRPFLFLSARGGRRPGGRVLDSLEIEGQQFRGVFDPSGERLALVLSSDEPAEIFTVNVSGGDLRRLTRNRSIDVSPSWSPDGEQIAFVSDRSGSPQVYVMDADGGNIRRLTYDGGYNSAPAWSPDGLWIAYESRVGGQFDIWLIDPHGGSSVPLVSHPASDEAPTWAPNARKLAFSSMRRGRSDIYVIDVNGDNLRRITRNAGDNKNPAWGRYPR
ncbi:MAG: PD40 domain-containing protein [Myxococcales bacterium]|nr:PD40 domain-containing protein [Myxococcales bacterium]